jgi:hypothetical protein
LGSKISAQAGPVVVPDATAAGDSEVRIEFTVKGKGTNPLIRNIVLGVDAAATPSQTGITDVLSASGLRHGRRGVALAFLPGNPSSLDVAFDGKAAAFGCAAAVALIAECEYIDGLGGYNGVIGSFFRPAFEGARAKGTWTLILADRDPDGEAPVTISPELELTTGGAAKKKGSAFAQVKETTSFEHVVLGPNAVRYSGTLSSKPVQPGKGEERRKRLRAADRCEQGMVRTVSLVHNGDFIGQGLIAGGDWSVIANKPPPGDSIVALVSPRVDVRPVRGLVPACRGTSKSEQVG